MKVTKYFISTRRATTQLALAVSEAEKIKEEFINDYKTEIDEIDHEDIKVVVCDSNNSGIYVIITLTYFPKAL